MADIQLRFHKDLLVLSTPVRSELARFGIDVAKDAELTLLLEPEVYDDIYRLECLAGVQCIVTDTASITPARLTHARMEDRADVLAKTAVKLARAHHPQHVLVEIGPCGLPLDGSSKASLNESRRQYERAARLFLDDMASQRTDAFFLNGFTSCTDLKCALMGIRTVSDAPLFASVDLVPFLGDESPDRLAGGRETLAESLMVMAEYGAQVVGFTTDAPLPCAAQLACQAKTAVDLPLLVQLAVRAVDEEQAFATDENPYFEPDTMLDVADQLRGCGVQFLRAVGHATPSYAGALVAATEGEDVAAETVVVPVEFGETAEFDAMLARLKGKVDAALGGTGNLGA